MNPRNGPVRTRRLGGISASLVVLVLVVGGSAAGCADGGDHGSATAAMDQVPASGAPAQPAAAAVDVPIGHMHMPTSAEVTAAWQARPDYVKALSPEWQQAYAFALARPDVLQWLPCYCGCEGMGHRSNLDCFFQRREEEGNYQFEEHASYCDICVDTANMASSMLRQGSTMTQIRAAVDATFGGGAAPGTDTQLPPT